MTLSSLSNDGPVLNITFNRRQDKISNISWSDFPVVGDEYQFKENPFELNTDVIQKDETSIRLTVPSSILPTSVSWSDFPAVGDGCDIGMSSENSSQKFNNSFVSSVENRCNEESINEMSVSRKTHRKSVSFNKFLEVRHHALTIGDHPSCRDSLPISLAWEHADTMMMDLDGFEAERQGFRRNGNEMKLSYYERKNMLRNISGLSEADMKEHLRHSTSCMRNLGGFSGI
mmetsp:Transcript_12668/g.18618  ORF Transcript_12668/g.18618 Transcript_12668/m.18618 type:complete len:230 (+) Transcript_12668:146-835(+)